MRHLTGHKLEITSRLASTGRLPTSTCLDLTLGLPLRNAPLLTNLIAELYEPASANYRQFLTPQQFDQSFGPTAEDYELVVQFAQTNGFRITGQHANHAILNVNASVADIERAFHLTLQNYQHPVANRTFFAPDTEPSLEASIPILDVSGLNNYALPHPKILKPRPVGRSVHGGAKAGSGPNGLFMGNDFRAAYAPEVSLDGSGQMIGLFEFDGYYAADITAYETQAGLPNVPLEVVLLDGFSGVPTTGANTGNAEAALDIELAIAMAPGLSKVIVYEAGPNGFANDVLSAMATNAATKQISCSWDFGSGPSATTEQLFQRFAAQGQSFFDASGDVGAYSGSIPVPDDDPYITIVGGTALATSVPGGAWVGETVWNSSGGLSSSGGFSTSYTIPGWQQGISMAANKGSTTMRNIPDVAMVADNIFIIGDNGQQEATGGTSAAAPLWAGFTALANQLAASKGRGPVGFINPAIYALGKGMPEDACYHDVMIGNNTNGNPNQFLAVPGFDLCTGWGTPNGLSLLLALAAPDQLLINPGQGFVATGPTGGPFNVSARTFVVTNSGSTPLNWSLGNPSPWLTASAASGTLPPGAAGTAVTLTLNDAAANLASGVYSSSIWFTNLSTGVAQNRQFTLLVGQNLVQNGGFEAGDFSWWDLAGANAAVLNFVDNGSNASIPPHSGSYLAALGQTNSLAYLSQGLATLAGEPYLVSFWLNSPAANNFPNRLVVEWTPSGASANILFDQQNLGAFPWSSYQFLVRATSSTTILAVGFRNDPDYFGLDDISVVPVPAPRLQITTDSGGNINLTWNALAGLAYQVQATTNLVAGQWINLGSAILATSNSMTASYAVGPDPNLFYRVVVSQ